MSSIKQWVTLGVVFVIAAIGGLMYVGAHNSDVRLRAAAKAQQKADEVVFDEMKKVIFQQAQVASKYAGDFEKVYVKLMNARYEGKDPLMNWITEHNPTLDPGLYKTLQTTIAAKRAKFTSVQNKLVDIKREHDVLLTAIPSCWFVGGRDTLQITIVTSTEAKEAFETGVDDNTDLF